jgi:hypothetical protein
MRLDKELELGGYFWLPNSVDSRLPGTLRIDELGSCTLEVLGIFGDDGISQFSPLSEPIPRICGIVDGGYVTLERCNYRRRNISFGAGVSKSSLSADVALIGAAFEDEEEIRINRFDFTIQGLDEWLATSGVTVEYNLEKKAVAIHYEPPEETALELPDMKLSFSFSWKLPSISPAMTQAAVSQTAFISAARNGGHWSLDDMFQLAHRLTNFICLAVDRTVSIRSVTAYSDAVKYDSMSNRIPMQLYYRSLPSSEKQSVVSDEMLFGFQDVKDDIGGAVAAWLSNYDSLSPAISLFLSAKAGAHRFTESRFLALAQGAETLHRRTSDESLMQSVVFAELVKEVIAGCPAEHAEWLEGRLTYANEPPLRVRMKRLIKPFNKHFGNEATRSSFIKKVCDTRNYLTHYDEKLSAFAAKGITLIGLTMKLECLIQLQLLRLMGLPPEKIEELASRPEFKQRINPGY